ncbi:MAG: DNA primase, partial [Clostridiales bacterium]|nr:DNA primase [Clostridiales bacterium]
MEELSARNNLVELAGKYLKLERKGRAWWACCPFHHEKTPSFKIDETMNLYYCFGCHTGGDVIKFIQNIENIDFYGAVKFLAERAHMRLPEIKDDQSIYAAKEKKDRLLSALREAARRYHENLWGSGGTAARAYLEKRGMDKRAVVRFGLGLSLGWVEMTEYLMGKGYKPDELKEAGLAGEKGGHLYDVFAGRLMFPIINNFGDVVSFGGRILEKDSTLAKYRNGAQTAVFDKGRTLYAVNLLRKRKQAAAIPYVIIVEGYMDVISLHMAGFDTALAGMGTALTAPQARILKNYADKVFVCYDGDSAGQTATIRGLDILSAASLDVRVVSLPDGLDPDDAIKRRGAEAFKGYLEQADGLIVFKLKVIKARNDMTRPAGRAKYAREAIEILKPLAPVEQEEYLKQVKSDTNYSIDSLKRQLATVADARPAPLEVLQSAENAYEDPAVKFILFSQVTNQ